ncbi:MAG TPA: calcium-binding protein, partial [Thermomicrobiales bacterium]|nr:calcium-binding protein [Thermomicrobiales bacterium]
DGYIAGATVFADKNGNGVRDAGEAFTGTDAFGRFELNSGNAPLVLAGGYDIAKGVSFQGKLSAQAGSAVVTPLTTLVVELGRAGVADPNATLAAALGMPAGTNFGQIDPIATAATSIAAFMHSNQILDTVTMVANLMVGANPTLGMERSIATVFAMLAAQAADGVLDLGDTATVEQVINGTAATLGVSGLSPSLVSDAAAVVAALDDAIDAIVAAGGTTASLLNQITAASIVAQGDASVSLKFAGQFNDGEGLVDGFTGAALANQINAAASQVANVTGTGTVGSGADDVISGNGGVHTFAGGGGKDTLSGGAGNDLLYGDAGDDVLNGQDDEDRLTGGAGNDQLNGGLGADIYIHSGTAADGSDTVNTGDDGFDRILFNTADLDDLNFMRDGNDLVLGASHSGGPAFDGSIRVVNHYNGASIFFAEIDTSHNTDYGLDPDSARFFFTTDLANGLENDDATEVLLGGNVADVIHGNGGFRDIIDGGGGNDLITGGDIGVDNIYGGAGNDQIDAGDGDDLISGDAGNDLLTGGGGSDTFLFNLSLSGADTLTDFDKASDILSFTGVADTNANGADLSDLLALVSGITNFGAGNDVVVNFSTGASLTFQGAGVSG